jgi:hypothetical protein
MSSSERQRRERELADIDPHPLADLTTSPLRPHQFTGVESVAIADLVDAVLLDIGGTLVVENAPGTAVDSLVPVLLPNVAFDLGTLARTVRLGAATNTAVMTEAVVRELLARVGIGRFFDVVVTSFDVGAAKPDPTVLLVAMDRLGIIDASRVLYVGDRPTDREAAEAAGMHFTPIRDSGLFASVLEWATTEAVRLASAPQQPQSTGVDGSPDR